MATAMAESARGRERHNPPATPPGGDRLTASIQKGLSGGSIEGDSNERFVGGCSGVINPGS
jgi:hypothetical protein